MKKIPSIEEHYSHSLAENRERVESVMAKDDLEKF